MSDLRNKLVKLAYNNPELRKDLLPLIKTASVSHTDLEKKVKKLLPEAGIEATKMRWLKKGDSAEMTHTGEEGRVWALKIKTYQNTEFVLRFEVPDRYERVKHVAVNTGRYDVASVPGVDWERELVPELDDLRQTMMI